jgi:hypothetical protein
LASTTGDDGGALVVLKNIRLIARPLLLLRAVLLGLDEEFELLVPRRVWRLAVAG